MRRVGLILLLLTAFAVRMWRLDNDPPPVDLVRDEAPWTDEGTIAHPVIGLLASGESCHSTAFVGGRSVHQMMLCYVFRCLGVGKPVGRFLNVLWGMVGLSALARLGSHIWPRWGRQLTSGLVASGFLYVAIDRAILTEGILVALLTCCALLGIVASKGWQGLLVGCLLGVLASGLKLHALALAPALMVLYALRHKSMCMPFLIGLAVILLVWRGYLAPGSTARQAIAIPTRVSHPTMGILDPIGAIGQVWFAGSGARFLTYQLPLLILASIEIIDFLLRPNRWLSEASPTVLVALPWFVTALIGASVFRYGPARYFHLASPPLVLLSVAGMRRLWKGDPFACAPRGRRLAVALCYGIWLLMQMFPPLPEMGQWARWFPLLGVPVPLLIHWLLGQANDVWGAAWAYRRKIVVVLLLGAQFVVQSALLYRGVVKTRPDLSAMSVIIADAMPERAVIIGRLAGTMALSGGFHGIPAYEVLTYSRLVDLSQTELVWVVVLDGDEELVEPLLWPRLERIFRFAVHYGSQTAALSVWQFMPYAPEP